MHKLPSGLSIVRWTRRTRPHLRYSQWPSPACTLCSGVCCRTQSMTSTTAPVCFSFSDRASCVLVLARVVSRMMANCDGNQIHLKAYGNHMSVRPSSVPCVFGLHASKCLFMWLPLTDRKAKTARCSTGRTWSRAPKNRFQLVCYAIESLWMALLRLIASPPVNHMRHHR